MTAAAIAGGETAAGRWAAAVVLPATAIKATWLGWQFMGLRSAHRGWRLGFATGIGLLLGLLVLLGPR